MRCDPFRCFVASSFLPVTLAPVASRGGFRPGQLRIDVRGEHTKVVRQTRPSPPSRPGTVASGLANRTRVPFSDWPPLGSTPVQSGCLRAAFPFAPYLPSTLQSRHPLGSSPCAGAAPASTWLGRNRSPEAPSQPEFSQALSWPVALPHSPRERDSAQARPLAMTSIRQLSFFHRLHLSLTLQAPS